MVVENPTAAKSRAAPYVADLKHQDLWSQSQKPRLSKKKLWIKIVDDSVW